MKTILLKVCSSLGKACANFDGRFYLFDIIDDIQVDGGGGYSLDMTNVIH